MEIVNQIKESINFLDKNLYADITYQDAADFVYMSGYNFHRTFKILTGITPNEYIRNRRLSKAGEEIVHTKSTILDLSLRFRYETLEGFSKAFKRFHGVSPSKARAGNVMLKTYHPLKINISFEGGKSMEYKIITLEPFTLLSKTREFKTDAEINLIPAFWDEQIKEGLLKKLFEHSSESGLYGACHQSDAKSNIFSYGIGVKVNQGTKIDGLDSLVVNNPMWAVFECVSVEHIGKIWEKIIKEFFVNTDYVRVDTLDFEFYPDGRDDIFCELYIPIRKK